MAPRARQKPGEPSSSVGQAANRQNAVSKEALSRAAAQACAVEVRRTGSRLFSGVPLSKLYYGIREFVSRPRNGSSAGRAWDDDATAPGGLYARRSAPVGDCDLIVLFASSRRSQK